MKYLLLALVILPCILFSISTEKQIIPNEMLLSPNNSIVQVDVEEDCLEINDEETLEELSDSTTDTDYKTHS